MPKVVLAYTGGLATSLCIHWLRMKKGLEVVTFTANVGQPVNLEPIGERAIAPVPHRGLARLGARVRPGWFVQTHEHPELVGRTLLEILGRGEQDAAGRGRPGMVREQAARALDRYELSASSEQRFESQIGRAHV